LDALFDLRYKFHSPFFDTTHRFLANWPRRKVNSSHGSTRSDHRILMQLVAFHWSWSASSKTFNRLAKSLKTSQQTTSKCRKIKISINIKEEQKAPSETMLQVDNRLVIACKQVSPRTNVEEF
jgi:hypothetical protein